MTTPLGGGRRQVTIAPASNADFPTNTLKSIKFQQATLVVYEVPGQPTRPFTINYAPGTTKTTFVVQRTGPGSAMARFEVMDDCGPWPTFVGAGPSAS